MFAPVHACFDHLLKPRAIHSKTWGCYEREKIIHFHGPKPFQRDEIDTVWPELKSYTGGAYLELIEVWQELLKKARSS